MQQRRFSMRVLAVLLGLLAFFGSTLVVQPPVAEAHAFVIGSDPADGSTVSTAPAIVRIYFNAPVSPLSVARVYAVQNGQLVDVTGGASRVAPTNARELDTPLKNPGTLPQGSYEVMWTAVSNNDGYTTYGLIGFDVGFSSTGLSGKATLGPTTSNRLEGEGGVRALTPVHLMAIFWDWLARLALTLWVGIVALELMLERDGGRAGRSGHATGLLERAHSQTRNLQWFCLLALLFSEIVTLSLRTITLDTQLHMQPLDPQMLLALLIRSNYGIFWIVRIVLLLTTMGLLYLARREQGKPAVAAPAQLLLTRSGPLRQFVTGEIGAVTTANITSMAKERMKQEQQPAGMPVPRYGWLWPFLTGLLLFTYALTSSVANVLQPHVSAVIFAWLGLAAQGLWLGSLAYSGYVLLPLLPAVELEHHAETLAILLRRLSPLLLWGTAILLLSELFLDEASISNMQQLIGDTYGRTLLVRLVIVLFLLLFNLYVLFILLPRIKRQAMLLPVVGAEMPARRARQSALEYSERRLRQASRLQAWLGAGALLCAALMVFFAPPIVFPQVNYGGQATTSPLAPENVQTKQIGDLSVTFQVLPGKVGQNNTVIMTLTGADGQPVTDAKVTLNADMPAMYMGGTGHAVINGGHPAYAVVYTVSDAFNMSGLWVIDVRIERPGKAAVKDTFQVNMP
ncbi:MAG: copper resistance protein CopC [Ktedonobacteraceae bacterium]|nr:copper resistance protein CopC [Ktedonobacteraceae bacterium]